MHAQSTRLRGHTASVLCLATSAAAATSASASPLLLSGSSDCTVRLWDLRTQKAVRCIARQAFGGGAHGEGAPVTAVAFHPTDEWTVMAAAGEAPQTDEAETDAGASGGGASASNTSAASAASSPSSPSLSSPAVYCFDLRASASIVLRSASHRWSGNSDEIAALRISDDGQLLAAADDAGDVRILRFNYAQPEVAEAAAAGSSAAASSASALPSASPRRVIVGATPTRTLLGHHTSLCSSTLFRPRPSAAASAAPSAPLELWSGGLDCAVLCFSLAAGRVTHRFSTQASASASASASQTLNPPFVHSLAFSPDGARLWAASGSAELVCIDAEAKRERLRLQGHTHSLMHCSVLSELPSSEGWAAAFGPAAHSSVVLTAGNDRALCLWDTREPLAAKIGSASSASASASSSSSSSASAKNRRKREKERERKAGAAAQAAGGDSDSAAAASSPPAPLLVSSSLPPSLAFTDTEVRALADSQYVRYRWRHPRKINAVASSFIRSSNSDDAHDQTSAAEAPSPSPADASAASVATGALCVLVADTSPDITAYWLR